MDRTRPGDEKGEAGALGDELDSLFTLPLAEFTGARNALASRLKKDKRVEEAERVKVLGKPSVSAWAVNQLYWKHREAFDRLIAAGERLREVQASHLTGKAVDIRGPRDARQEALSELLRLSAGLLQDADHNPSPDIMRRITTTLEALSAYSSRVDVPHAGRLTEDLDPPGFDALAALIPDSGVISRTPKAVPATPSQKPANTKTVAAAKASLKNPQRVLTDARARASRAGEMLKKATADAKQAVNHKREAEQRFLKANAAAEEAAERARNTAIEAEEAARAVEDAMRAVETASRELER